MKVLKPHHVRVFVFVCVVVLISSLRAATFTVINPNDAVPGSLLQAMLDPLANGGAR